MTIHDSSVSHMTRIQWLTAAAGYKVYASEGAHSSFAPRGDLQRQIQAYIEDKFGYCEGEIFLRSHYCQRKREATLLCNYQSMLCLTGQHVAVSGRAQHSLIHSFICSFICSATQLLIHSLIHPICSLTM